MSQVEGNSRKKLTQKQYNPADLVFADHVGKVIATEWEEKFLGGALCHGGPDKTAFMDRKGMVRESLNEAYDLLSYLHNLDLRIIKAARILMQMRDEAIKNNCTKFGVSLDEVINLLA